MDSPNSKRRSLSNTLSNPYARLHAKEAQPKRRRIWCHSFEKTIFTPQEISTIPMPIRRKIYTASLEAHIDSLHYQLELMGIPPVAPHELEPYRGLNSKTTKSIVSGLQHDASVSKLKLLELDRAVRLLKLSLSVDSPEPSLRREHTSDVTDCNSPSTSTYL